jgi:hypothetical protein
MGKLNRAELWRLRELVEGLLPSPAATVLFSREQRICGLARLFRRLPREFGYRGNTSDYDALEQWSQELAVRRMANANR